MLSAVLFAPSYAAPAADSILLVDFSGKDKAATFDWKANNDPVMGGQSHSTVKVENGHLNFTGTCAIVPSLKAPGFITAVAGNQFDLGDAASWKDVSGCEGLTITANSATYRLAAELRPRAPDRRKVLRVRVQVALHAGVGSMGASPSVLELHRLLGRRHRRADPHVRRDAALLPRRETLANMKTMSIWAEGVEATSRSSSSRSRATAASGAPDCVAPQSCEVQSRVVQSREWQCQVRRANLILARYMFHTHGVLSRRFS